MVQMTRAALQALTDTIIAENTSGAITATLLNTLLTDIIDSVDILPSGSLAPVIRSFSIENQPLLVDPGTTISGSKVFDWTISEAGNVNGDLTLDQDGSDLSTTIDPAALTFTTTIDSVTLNGGETTVFTLSGVDTFTNPFSRTFTIEARTDDDYVYYSFEADNDPSDVDIGTANRTPFGGASQQFQLPTLAGNGFLTILQRASDPDLTQIVIDGLNQLDAFTKTDDALTVNSENFDAYVSTNELIGSVISGDIVSLVR